MYDHNVERRFNFMVITGLIVVVYMAVRFMQHPNMRTAFLLVVFGLGLCGIKILLFMIRSNWSDYEGSKKVFAVIVFTVYSFTVFLIEDVLLPCAWNSDILSVMRESKFEMIRGFLISLV